MQNNWIISGRKGLILFPPIVVSGKAEAMSLVAALVANHFKGIEHHDDKTCYNAIKDLGINPDKHDPEELISILSENGIISVEMNDKSTDKATIHVMRVKLPDSDREHEFIFMVSKVDKIFDPKKETYA